MHSRDFIARDCCTIGLADFDGKIRHKLIRLYKERRIYYPPPLRYEDDLILPLLIEKVNQQFFGKSKRKISFSSSKLGRQANLLSCMNLIMEYYVQSIGEYFKKIVQFSHIEFRPTIKGREPYNV